MILVSSDAEQLRLGKHVKLTFCADVCICILCKPSCAQSSPRRWICQTICRHPFLSVQVFDFTAERRAAWCTRTNNVLEQCIIIDAATWAFWKVDLYSCWSFPLLPPTILDQSYHFRSPFTLLKKLIEFTALKMLPGSSDAHPNIMNYGRRSVDLSLKLPAQ